MRFYLTQDTTIQKLGVVVTNVHVVGNAKIVDVTFVDGNRYTAKVVASDIYSDTAVIQISGRMLPRNDNSYYLLLHHL